MEANGLVKLVEEAGELLQAIGKKLAYYNTENHPDGGEPLLKRIEDESADVLAAISFVTQEWGLDQERMSVRKAQKLAQYNEWHSR